MSANLVVLELYKSEENHKTLVEVVCLEGYLPAEYKTSAFIFKATAT